MALIQEDIKCKTIKDLSISVLKPESGEYYEEWEIISTEFPFSETYTPDELEQIGKWLIEQANYVRSKYTHKGTKARKQHPHI